MARDTTRRRLLGGIGASVTAGLAGCGSNGGETATGTPTDEATPTSDSTATDATAATETSGPTGSIRVAHLSPNAPNVDVFVDGSAVLEDVPYGTVSGYLAVPAGDREVEIRPVGGDAAVFSGSVSVAADSAYTVAATGEVGEEADESFAPVVTTDDLDDPGSDTARVGLLHASPDAPAVDVTLASSGDAVFDGVAFGETATVEVPAGEYRLEVRGTTESNDGDVVAAFDVELAGGRVYSAFATGYLTADDEPDDPPFDVELIDDTGEREVTAAPAPARVRVAHFAPNAPSVDVLTDQMLAVNDLAYGQVTAYRELTPGGRPIQIRPADDPSTDLFADRVPLTSGVDYTLVATGEVGEEADESFAPVVLRDDDGDPGEETARIRLLHASPDAPAVDVTLASTGEAVFDGVAFGETATVEVPSGGDTLQVRGATESNDGDVVATSEVQLSGGQVYTAFAGGYLTPEDEPGDTPFTIALSNDNEGTAGGLVDKPARLRVAHLSPDAPTVDVAVDGTQVRSDVPFGAVSAYLDVPPGERSVTITPAGGDTPVYSGSVSVESDTPYTLAATGEVSEEGDEPFGPLVLDDGGDYGSDDTIWVRLVHASPDAPAVNVTLSGEDPAFDPVSFGESDTVGAMVVDDAVEVVTADGGELVGQFRVDAGYDDGLVTLFAAGYASVDDEPVDTSFELIAA
ncbi:DUF4397 domain-containing protein [Halobaculum sp. MBLA0147]|uniref:DUF4397 domain-containing protein n=1 Tax=Halobaculum sp. MBLA0147 TaxID=3079934 RepID=UPI0035256396